MAAETTNRFEQFLAVRRVARGLSSRFHVECGLPEECRDCLDLIVIEPEGWHLGTGSEGLRIREPNRDPVFTQLGLHLLQVRSDLLYILHQVLSLGIKLVDARINLRNHLTKRLG